MGNTTNYLIIMLMIHLITGVMALGIYAVNPDSQYLLGNYVFNVNNNAIGNQTEVVNGVRVYNFTYGITGLSGLSSSAFVEGTTDKQPDWIKAGNTWLNSQDQTVEEKTKSPAVVIISFIGSPYSLLSNAGINNDLSALIGVFFAILTTFIYANWFFGRDT